jgi:integrase
MTATSEKILAAYLPAIPEAYWDTIRDFVLSSVTEVLGKTPYDERDLLLVTTRLSLWCWQTLGMQLDPNVVLSRQVVDRFCAEGLPGYSEATRGNFRSQLLRMSELLLDAKAISRRLTPLKAANPSRPYSDAEVIALRSWSEHQSTSARRINARVLMALGLGAGLSAIEIGELRVADIQSDSEGLLIKVSAGRVRSVPVLREWEPALLARAEQLNGDQYAFRENHKQAFPNLISGFVARSRQSPVLPQSQRLRATWIVRHLNAGTPVVPLLRAAGVESLEALTRYVRFTRPIDEAEARAMLSSPRL